MKRKRRKRKGKVSLLMRRERVKRVQLDRPLWLPKRPLHRVLEAIRCEEDRRVLVRAKSLWLITIFSSAPKSKKRERAEEKKAKERHKQGVDVF